MTTEPFTPEQLRQMAAVMETVVHRSFADAGLRLDGTGLQDEAREDFRFLRRMRRAVDGGVAKIGWLVITAIVGGLIWLFSAGLNLWKGG